MRINEKCKKNPNWWKAIYNWRIHGTEKKSSILPPDYENLPTPDDDPAAKEEISNFEKTLGISIEDNSSESSSAEESILKKIRSK